MATTTTGQVGVLGLRRGLPQTRTKFLPPGRAAQTKRAERLPLLSLSPDSKPKQRNTPSVSSPLGHPFESQPLPGSRFICQRYLCGRPSRQAPRVQDIMLGLRRCCRQRYPHLQCLTQEHVVMSEVSEWYAAQQVSQGPLARAVTVALKNSPGSRSSLEAHGRAVRSLETSAEASPGPQYICTSTYIEYHREQHPSYARVQPVSP